MTKLKQNCNVSIKKEESKFMKIVYATDTYWPRINGVTVSIASYKKRLESHGHEVHVITPYYPNCDDEEENIHRFSSYKLLFTNQAEDRLVYPWKKKKVHKKLEEIKPDIIHIQTEFTVGIMAMKYGIKNDIPIITTSHTYFEEYINIYFPFLPKRLARTYARGRVRKFHNKANAVIAPTERMKNVLLGYDLEKPIHVIPTGISKKDFGDLSKKDEKNNSHLYKKYPKLKGKKILSYVGRIGAEKNIYFLFDVIKQLKEKFPEIVLLLAGDGPQRDELKKFVKNHNLTKNIIFLGYIDWSKIKHVYALSDIFIFSSKTETQGLVTIEAMMCKTPVVALGIMGTLDVMQGDNGGFMVDEDLDIFTEKVNLLLTDSSLYKKKSDEAFKYAQNWTLKKTTEKMEQLYTSIFNKK